MTKPYDITNVSSDLVPTSLKVYYPSPVKRTIESKLEDTVSVKDFGAVGNGVANDSAAIQNAVNTGKKVYIPSGTYLCNVVITNKTIIEGDGSTATILIPFNTATALSAY